MEGAYARRGMEGAYAMRGMEGAYAMHHAHHLKDH